MNKDLMNKIINAFETNILPMTKKNVKKGNKIFGAFILSKKDYSIITSGINKEIENPLWHGEISALKNFYEIKSSKRPNSKDCFFISSHEPCSLCLSAITWCGFNNFYYLFSYEQTKNKHKIPHDLNILKEVFKINRGEYNHNNNYWESFDINQCLKKFDIKSKKIFNKKIQNIKDEYRKVSEKYQRIKNINMIPLK